MKRERDDLQSLESNSTCSRAPLDSIDWNFSNLVNEGLHVLHWYPGTFVSAIPGTLIPLLSEKGDVIVDPFCGTSITGLEAIRLGRRFFGVDINPVAVLISRARLTFPEPRHLRNVLADIVSPDILVSDNSLPPHANEKELRRWYHAETFHELKSMLYHLLQLPTEITRLPALAIFSSILKSVSSQGRHWGWVCDNVAPKPDEIIYKNARDAFVRALDQYVQGGAVVLEDMENRSTYSGRKDLRSKWSLRCADAIEVVAALEPHSVQLILTSPPYYGVADYVKSQRLTYLWFKPPYGSLEGYVADDFEDLRRKEVGSRSFSHRRSSLEEYTDYLDDFLGSVASRLRPGGYLALIIGESRARESVEGRILTSARDAGLSQVFSVARRIRQTRRRLMGEVPVENLMLFKLCSA